MGTVFSHGTEQRSRPQLLVSHTTVRVNTKTLLNYVAESEGR